jgi:hypothetical protein
MQKTRALGVAKRKKTGGETKKTDMGNVLEDFAFGEVSKNTF